MSCYRPITAWKPYGGGKLVFTESADCRELKIACGQCIGCRIAKQEMWAIRCFAESKMHAVNCFITLTYDESHVPQYGSLNYRDYQLFMKRLRKKIGAVRFFMCGEYGGQTERPHYHALLFGYDFPDKEVCNSIRSRDPVFRSPLLESLWPFGFSSIGEVTYASARYCATYAVKKITGDRAADYYARLVPETGEIIQLEPEFASMSRRPGIGYPWLEKYWRDLYTVHDAFIVDGKRKAVPRYFDSKMDDVLIAEEFERLWRGEETAVPLLMDDVSHRRFIAGESTVHERTRERLEAREAVAIAQRNFNNERSSRSEI